MSSDDVGANERPQPDVDVFDPDPLDALEGNDQEDPTPEEITAPDHPDYVEPADGVTPYTAEEAQ